MPGAMPEIVPGGDFGADIDRLLTGRSMVVQAWGSYGTLWPVVRQWLGVSPDVGRRPLLTPELPRLRTLLGQEIDDGRALLRRKDVRHRVLMVEPVLQLLERRRHVEDDRAVLAGRDPSRGEGSAIAHVLHVVDRRDRRIPAENEVAVQ
jgi:hypothetical protein